MTKTITDDNYCLTFFGKICKVILMKKLGAALICSVLFIIAVSCLLMPNFSEEVAEVQARTDTWFADRHDFFQKFDYSSGIFILRDNKVIYDKSDEFFGDISIRAESNMYRKNPDPEVIKTPLEDTQFWVFKCEAVVYEKGSWVVTNLFSVDFFENRAVWTLPKQTPAGLYGVRVTAFEQAADENGNKLFRPLDLDEDRKPKWDAEHGYFCDGGMILNKALDFDPKNPYGDMIAVEGVFVVLYGDELSYINMTDSKGKNIYDARTRTDRQVTVDVNVNGGGMVRDGLVETLYPETKPSVMGNLTLDASVILRTNSDIVEVRLEDVGGNVLFSNVPNSSCIDSSCEVTDCTAPDHRIKKYSYVDVEVYASHIQLSISNNLPAAKYYLKVIDKRSADVYGIYLIDNVGKDTFGGIISGNWFVIPGLLMLAGAVFMFVGPRAAVYLHERKYKAIEKSIEDNVPGEEKKWKAQSAKDSLKNAKKKVEETTEDELKAKVPEKQTTKGSEFLFAMAERRMKRETAREAGISMEEFKALDENRKKADEARKSSLSDVRKKVEEGSFTGGFETLRTEEEESVSFDKKPKDAEPEAISGDFEIKLSEPEISMLDSFETDMSADEKAEIRIRHKGGSLSVIRDEEDGEGDKK